MGWGRGRCLGSQGAADVSDIRRSGILQFLFVVVNVMLPCAYSVTPQMSTY